MKPNLTFVEDTDNRQSVIYGANVENDGEYIKFKQFNAPNSSVDYFMNGPLKEVKEQIKKVLTVEDTK